MILGWGARTDKGNVWAFADSFGEMLESPAGMEAPICQVCRGVWSWVSDRYLWSFDNFPSSIIPVARTQPKQMKGFQRRSVLEFIRRVEAIAFLSNTWGIKSYLNRPTKESYLEIIISLASRVALAAWTAAGVRSRTRASRV